MKRVYMLVLAATMLALMAAPVIAATWTKIGTSGLTTSVSQWQDWKRVRISDVAIDDAGNVYVVCNNGDNGWYEYKSMNPTPIWHDGTGGVTIFLAGGGKIDVNVSSFTDPTWGANWKNWDGTPRTDNRLAGAITKLVKGGDGAIYALMNFVEINWDDARQNHRIVRINPNGTVDAVWSPGPAWWYNSDAYSWTENEPLNYPPTTPPGGQSPGRNNKIRALCVNPDDGNLYWTMNGANSYWKYNFLWCYDVAAGSVTASPANDVNRGWSETHKFFDLEYVGNGFFAVLSTGSATWRLDAIKWEKGADLNEGSGWPSNFEGWRHLSTNGAAAPGWGRKWVTAMAYDPVRKKFWAGGRNEGTPPNTTHIMSRWDGSEANPGMFTGFAIVGYDPGSGEPDWWAQGITQNYNWHANGNDPLATGYSNGSYWISCMAVDPSDGTAWMSYGGENDFPFTSLFGRVLTRDIYFRYGDRGMPEAGARVVGLTFDSSNTPYAVALNMSTGEFSLYRADDKSDESVSTISGAKTAGLGRPTNIDGAVVSSVFTGSSGGEYVPVSFAVQDADRACGIRAISGSALNPGDVVTVTGIPLDVDGEVVFFYPTITVTGSVGTPSPFSISGIDTGGGGYGQQLAVMNDVGPPAKFAVGMNNVGLLVKISGKVTAVNSAGDYTGYFYVDDGYSDPMQGISTGLKDGSGNVGIKCRPPTGLFGMPGALPDVGDYVDVVGVTGVTKLSAARVRTFWTVDWSPASFTTRTRNHVAKWSLLSLPAQPKISDPAIVFGSEALPNPEKIDGRLYRWDGPTQSLGMYDMWAPDLFGAVNSSEGYWLNAQATGQVSYAGYNESPSLDRWISAPVGWKLMGNPFTHNTYWENWSATDGTDMKSIFDASQYGANWMQSIGYWWNDSTQSLSDLGLPDDFPQSEQLNSWYGYWVKTNKNLGLVAPQGSVAP